MHNRRPTVALKRMLNGVVLVILGLFLVLLIIRWIDFRIIRPAFLHLEKQQAIGDSRRVQSAIEIELASLSDMANDWAIICFCCRRQQRLHSLELSRPSHYVSKQQCRPPGYL
ncbi:MAG: hypothetical protein VR65_26760 [Desulfobulbaceae bacterium BRH_c16a]|nr:MAG: hypothetical protein VR65_26760 [Desulfobulbaceae bacterium BRH_c16a]